MLIVSFCTDDSHYRRYYDAIRRNLDDVGLEHDVRLIPQRSTNKVAVCCDRARYILDRLNEHQRMVVWLDADSIVHRSFMVRGAFDFAYCRNPIKRRGHNAITCGVFGFGNTDGARELLRAWDAACGNFDQDKVSSHDRLDQLKHSMTHLDQQDITATVKGRLTFYGGKGRVRIPV